MAGGYISANSARYPVTADAHLADALGLSGARAATFASGGLLAMMTNSLMPFAFDRGGALAGIMTVVGFAVSVASAA
jgi:hypothetical protein